MENNEFFGPTESVGEKGGDDVLVAENLKKTFRLSAKQRKIEKTPLREKVAVAGGFLPRQARRNLRAFRPQRRGQNHYAAHAGHPD